MPPAELEAVLLRHPDVTDAAVIGLPDDEAAEVPAGYVVLRRGAAACAGCSANLLVTASLEELVQRPVYGTLIPGAPAS